ncbi:hypothetical protein AVEN_116936-1 [Araneus ventricosus]|uniref:Integrase catalytic domain-containing protein n=1 Tax=Araneus ventricosus TaxID=182803 RepID=A0A4Y2M851_ARAVE|nr:hypothetical protein AVEN_116936-1 [Araneus ventricosus]
MCNQLAEIVPQTLYTGWISRFGVPEIITSDRGTNFETNCFQALSIFLGASKTRTTSFHPAANGIVERMHRQLKSAIKCYVSSSWLEVLPTILLGMRGCLKEDIGASSAEMVYGQCLRLPGEFFRNSTSSRQMLSEDTFLQRLRLYTRSLLSTYFLYRFLVFGAAYPIRGSCARESQINFNFYTKRLRPVSTFLHSSSIFFVHPDLRASSHVFVHCDTVRKPLEQPYQRPFKVIRRNEEFFTLIVNERQSTISIDRLKPSYVLPDVSSESSLSKTAESKCQKVSKQPVTRYGRRVRLVEPYQAY